MKTKAKLMASVKIWFAIYPSITLFLSVFGEKLAVLPLYQRTLLLTLSLVPWVVFVGVPLVDSIARLISPQPYKREGGMNRVGVVSGHLK